MTRWDLRRDYRDPPTGRDTYMVKAIGPWLESVLTRALREPGAGSLRVLDIGCGEQPLRHIVEREGGVYAGFDIDQNSQGSVDIIGFIDRELPTPWPDATSRYDVLLCSEVLEHVPNWEAAFKNLRVLVADAGCVVITVPFIFPVHMEPLDFFRGTFYAIEQLAKNHDFVVDELVKLGNARDVLATVLEDISILPATPTVRSRLASRVIRMLRTVLVRSLQRGSAWSLVQINANTYLSNGVVLRPAKLGA